MLVAKISGDSMFSISEIGFSKSASGFDDDLLRSFFMAYVFNSHVANEHHEVIFHILEKMSIDVSEYKNNSSLVKNYYAFSVTEKKANKIYSASTNKYLTDIEMNLFSVDNCESRVGIQYLHDIRTALCHENRSFFENYLECLYDFTRSRDFRHLLCVICKEFWYEDTDDIADSLIYSIPLLKLYLNIPFDEDEMDYMYHLNSSRYAYFLEPITYALEGEDFFKDLHPNLASYLCAIALKKMTVSSNTGLYRVLTQKLPDNLLSDKFLYYRDGCIGRLKDFFESNAYELFFKGDFEKCINFILDYQKRKRKEQKGYKISERMSLILNCSRLIADVDLLKAQKECTTAAKRCIKTDLRIAAAHLALLNLYAHKTGQKSTFLSTIQSYFSLNNIKTSLDRVLCCFSVFNEALFICYAVSDDSFSYARDAKVLQSLFENVRSVFPAFARRLYPTLNSLSGGKLHFEDDCSEYFDFTKFNVNTNVWKNQLSSIMDILKIDNKAKTSVKKPKKSDKPVKRLAWVYDLDESGLGHNFNLTPYEAFEDPATGEVTLENSYSPTRFYTGSCAKQEHVTEQDRLIGSNYNREQNYYSGVYYILKYENAIPLTENHPYIFISKDSMDEQGQRHSECIRARVVEKTVTLSIAEQNDKLHLTMNFPENIFGAVGCDVDFKNALVSFTRVGKVHYSLKKIVGEGIDFPKDAINELSSLALSSDVSVEYDVKSDSVLGDARTAVLIEDNGRYFTLRLRVKPLDEENVPFKIPGRGEASLICVKSGSISPVVVERNLKLETDNAKALCDTLKVLSNFDSDPESYEYRTDNLEDVLGLLSAINKEPSLCSLHWAKGKKISVSGSVTTKGIKLGTSIKDGLLAIEGSVELSVDRYISLRALLDTVNETPGHYVKVDDETYVEISSELKSQLQKLRALTVDGKKDTLLAHPLSAQALENLMGEVECSFTDDVRKIIEKRDEAMALDVQVPKTLTADLRPYQKDGFSWLYRLSSWGVGACLADDMGLGKTIQTIALILKLCKNGPSLIVCPTSLGANWTKEFSRFAPTLTVKRLKDSDKRNETIEGMKANEVLIVSYGLFVNESESLFKTTWETVVYDEAQSLKNSMTQRAKTAVKINSKMSIALTGTPIENNLDDLWSIFNIINPGLLGTVRQFRSRFANASSDKNAARILKLIISPFIMRRLKNDVLDDLPSRTEQVITVEPSEREAELYEALRLKTLDDLEKESLPKDKSGQRRLQILSALTRIRQFCCDPALISEDLGTSAVSSKSEAFCDLLDEALSGGHRVLVFSQFVGYLIKVREILDKKQISYQYLDGQTPEKKRAEAVDSFQSGEGDVFLISLKAGGQGLNLTGADYVMHLDPWWNPAVEDQATDRAYRIGQTRPVNVFRFVMKDSIEEKILELHAKKREISATFLSGTSEVAAEAMKLSEEELLNLLS